MFERFTEIARKSVVIAQDEARSFGHSYIGTEHLLLGLMKEESTAASVLGCLGVYYPQMRETVGVVTGQGDEGDSQQQLPFTPKAKVALEAATIEALRLNHSHIGSGHLLLGLTRTDSDILGPGVAMLLLRKFEVNADMIRKTVLDHTGYSTFNDPRYKNGYADGFRTAVVEMTKALADLELPVD